MYFLYVIFKIWLLFFSLFIFYLNFLLLLFDKIVNKRELLEHFIRLLAHNNFRNSFPILCTVIYSSVISVFISNLRKILYTRISHLYERSNNCPVISIIIKSAIVVTKIIFEYFFEDIREKGHKMSSNKTHIIS